MGDHLDLDHSTFPSINDPRTNVHGEKTTHHGEKLTAVPSGK